MKNAIFIHSNLDNLGLKSSEFRVLCHVARRGKCWETVPSMAKICCMHSDTVRKALKALVSYGLLVRKLRVGTTTIYLVDHQKIINTPVRKGGDPPYENEGDPPYENEGDKVYPIKVIPLRNTSPRGNGLSKNVQLIDLGKAMKQLVDEADEYKGVHRGEAAGGEYHWDKGTREIWQAKRKRIKELGWKIEALRMD